MSTFLNKPAFDHILPLYKRLSETSLLERCQAGGTQNANESLHSVVWNKVPKETFVSRKRLEMGVINAIAEFNMGRRAALHLKAQSRGGTVSAAADAWATAQDSKRITKAEGPKTSKKAEKSKVAKEGPSYGAGEF